MLEIFNPGKFILSFYSTEVRMLKRRNPLPLQDSISIPLHEELKSCVLLQKWKREELQICNNEVLLNPFSSYWTLSESFFLPGLGALLCKLCCCSYLGHVAPGSSPGTDKKLTEEKLKKRIKTKKMKHNKRVEHRFRKRPLKPRDARR